VISVYAHPRARPWLSSAWTGEERPPTIVMIEDDAGIADMYRRQLAIDGYRVLIAADGVSGLELVRSARPNLVLLDVLLPEMEGFTVLQHIREDPAVASIPVVVLSNYGEPDMMRRGMAAGAINYLIKSSTTPVQLSARVRRWLGSKTDD
jgi:two-component system response regulator FitH